MDEIKLLFGGDVTLETLTNLYEATGICFNINDGKVCEVIF